MKKDSYIFNLKTFKYISAIIIILLTNCKDELEVKEESIKDFPWGNNQILELKSDSLKCIFYDDTLILVGPLKNTCYKNYRTDEIFNESVILKNNETYPDYIARLYEAKIYYSNNCSECGDSNFWEVNEQNLEIISLYSLIKMNRMDSALLYLNSKHKKWSSSSRYSDLYVAILLNTIGRHEIEKKLNDIPNINCKDSVLIGNHWIQWWPIREYNYNLYQENINWKHYFKTTMDRIEQQGI